MAGDMSLGKMKISLGLDGKGVTDGISKLERDIKRGVKDFSSFSAATRRGGQELEITKAKIGMLGNSVQNMSKITKSYGDALNDNAKMSKYTVGEQAKLRQEYSQSQVKLNAYKQQFVDTSREMAEMQVKTTGWTGQLNKVGGEMTRIGGSMTKGLTLPLAAVGTMALKVGFDFEEAMGRVQAIAGASKSELEQLTAQARKLGKDTSFNAQEVAQGMENLASAGFSVNEIMSAMPGLMDLAAVSGRDIGAASEIAASTMRAFGLEADKSGHVADVFARAAADTNAETVDMGEAMKYAAPVASQLGISMEETASAIGIMSDNGIKGTQAGTSLRGALTRLAKPTKAMTGVMSDYGLSFFDASGKMKPFGDLLGQLQSKLGPLDDKTRSAALTTLFGQNALSGMMALVGTAPGKYDELTKSLVNSDGAADEMARTMQDNAKMAIESMTGSLEDVAISVAQIVAPSVRDLANLVENAADAFTALDPEAQKMIVNLGLIAMAAGPAVMILGKVSTGVVAMNAAFRGAQAAKGAAATFEVLGKTASSSAVGMGTLGVGAGKAMGALGLMGPVTLGVVGVVAALGLTVGGIKWLEGRAHAKRWGDGVSEEAGKSLDTMQRSQQGINQAMMTTAEDGKKTSKEVAKAFDEMTSNIEKNVKETNERVKGTFNELPEDIRALYQKDIDEFKKANDKKVEEAKSVNATIQEIQKKNGELTIDQQTYINNARMNLNAIAVETLGLSGKQQREALNRLNSDVNKMSASSRLKAIEEVRTMYGEISKKHEEQIKQSKKLYDEGSIDQKTYEAGIKSIDKTYDDVSNKMIARTYELMKSNGMSTEEMINRFQAFGITIKDAENIYNEYSKSVTKNSGTVIDKTGKMSEETQKAVDKWNDLVFDKKTGDIKTNAVEEVAKAMESKDEWNSMKLAAKEANVGSNARKIFTEAAIQSGKWNSMKLEEKKATVNSDVAKRLLDDKDAVIEFNTLTIPEKKIVMSSNSAETVEKSLRAAGLWDNFNPKLKKLIAETNAPIVAKNGTDKIKEWDNLTPQVKKLLTENYATAKFNDAIKSQKDWDNLPVQVKKLLADNSNVRTALDNAGIKIGEYNSIPVSEKHMTGNASSVSEAAKRGEFSLGQYNGTKVDPKKIDAEWRGQPAVNTAKTNLDSIPESTKKYIDLYTRHHRAGGDPYFMGGPVTVNDQKGSSYRELIRLPNGREMLPSGRDVEMNLPTGTRIFNASETNQIMAQRREMSQLASYNEVGQRSQQGISDGNISNLLSQLNRTSGAGMTAIEHTARLILRAVGQQSGKDIFGSNSYETMARDERNRNAQTL